MKAIQYGLCCLYFQFASITFASGKMSQTQVMVQSSQNIDSSSIGFVEVVDWHDLIDEMAENGLDVDLLEERLTELANNPIPLNEASREMLESLPMLHPDQVENLSYYLYRYGPIVNLSELMLVEGMTAETMRWLRPFVRIGTRAETPLVVPPMKKAWNYGKQEIRYTMGAFLQEKAGYDDMSEEGTESYVGDPVHASLRYGFDYKGQLQWGVVLEKDPGERWWNSRQSGVDYASFHFLAKDPKRRNMCLFGDFNARFGQGLVCGNAFSLGKNSGGITPEQTGTSLSRHFSTSESKFFRGVAVQLTILPFLMDGVKRFGMDFCTFVSKRSLDASIENGLITKTSETGLHRTEAEINMERSMRQSVVGGHIRARWLNLTGGLTALYWQNNAAKYASGESWNTFEANGKMGGNLSADMRLLYNSLLMFGEVAVDQKGHEALLVGMSFKPYPRMGLTLLGRSYSPAYQAIFSNAFAEGTSTRNEEGVYTSMDVLLVKRLHLTGYVDVFRFPWLNYAVNTPSYGQDVAMEISSTVGRNGLIKLLIKNKIKEKQDAVVSNPTHPTLPGGKSSIRLQISQKIGIWSMKTIIFGNDYHFRKSNTGGMAIAQDLAIETTDNRFTAVFHAALFQTQSWENRIYLWEKDVPGAFSMPMLYGQGSRLSLYLKYEIRSIHIQFKLSDMVQPGMEVLGDGPEQILGSRRTEAHVQLSWKF